MSAAIAYYTVFSMPAVMVIVVSVAGFFVEPEDVQGRIRSEIRSVVGSSGAEQVQTMIEHANRAGHGIVGTIVGTVVLIFGATGVMGELQAALNDAWDVKPNENASAVKSYFVKRLVSLAMVISISFVLLVSLVLSTILSAIGDKIAALLPGIGSDAVLMVGNGAATYAVISGMFAFMFKFLPDAVVRWRDVWLGAAITGILFVAGKWLLGMYLARSDIASTYGAAGSLALILTWVYYSALIVLFGAEFTQVWSRRGEATAA